MLPNRPTLTLCASAALACLLFVFSVAAQEEKKPEDAEKATVEAKKLVTNLLNPSGLAVNPDSGQVFIANRHGVYRYLPEENAKRDELRTKLKQLKAKKDPSDDEKKEISKLEVEFKLKSAEVVVIEIHTEGHDVYGKGPMYDIGPLGVAFLDADQLVVGDGSRKDGVELVRIYKIGKESPAEPAKEDSAVHTIGPIKAKEGVTAKGEGNFYGIAVGGGAIFVTCNGDDTKGWVAKIEIKDGKPGEMIPAIPTKEATKVDAPVAITFSPDGKELVVGQMGEMTVPGDSLLTIYDPATGKLKKSYKTGLSDIAGLAYSPKTGKLYATDFAWAEPENGGLFELVIDGDDVKATKILKLDKPAAIAFDKDGNLYLTEFGSAAEGSKKNPGSLSVIEAGL